MLPEEETIFQLCPRIYQTAPNGMQPGCAGFRNASELCTILNESRAAVYLFGNWIPQDWGQRAATHEEQGRGKHFGAELLYTATRLKYSQVVEGLLIAGAEVDACLDGKIPLIISAVGDIGERDGNKRT